MTPIQMQSVISAHARGEKVEWRHKGLTTWSRTVDGHEFDFSALDYRINGSEFGESDASQPTPEVRRSPSSFVQPRPEPDLGYSGVTYRYGQKFRNSSNDDIYVLCQAAPYMMGFIGVESGNRWSEFIAVHKPEAVTQTELDRMSGSERGNFRLINDASQAIGTDNPANPNEVFKVGDKFMIDGCGPYMLARTGFDSVVLSNMLTGNRWGDVKRVKRTHTLYMEDMREIAVGASVRLATTEEIRERLDISMPPPVVEIPIGTTSPSNPGVWYSRGIKAMLDGCGPYLLVQVGEKSVCFINANDGNRWTEPVLVRDPHKLYMEDLKAIANEDDVVVVVNE